MGWKEFDERLIRREEILLDLEFVEEYEAALNQMNLGKMGRPFTLTRGYIQFLPWSATSSGCPTTSWRASPNLGSQKVVAEVHLDLSALGIPHAAEGVDSITKEKLQSERGILKVPLEAQRMRMVLLQGPNMKGMGAF